MVMQDHGGSGGFVVAAQAALRPGNAAACSGSRRLHNALPRFMDASQLRGTAMGKKNGASLPDFPARHVGRGGFEKIQAGQMDGAKIIRGSFVSWRGMCPGDFGV